ncbi:MAG: phosphoribosylformylglycinamidine cyclo-ligase [Polyangiales bacterium]
MDAGERLVERIKPLAAATRIPEVLGSVGGFAGLCAVPEGLTDPILVSGTDGVGTKLKLAFAFDQHGTVGIDLVAMCVNDILTVGARPLFFLDYFGTGSLDVDRAEEVVRGIANGCKEAGCALLGGETAELPGFYKKGEYDLAGFAVGVVERAKMIDGTKVGAGDTIIALPSSGLHSNGFSLARAALKSQLESGGTELALELLTPTRIYARASQAAVATGHVRAMCHVTGGGLVDNLPRVLPEGMCAHIDESSWTAPSIFERIASAGDIEQSEMRRTFNMGVGFIFVVSSDVQQEILKTLNDAGESPSVIGTIEAATDDVRVVYA